MQMKWIQFLILFFAGCTPLLGYTEEKQAADISVRSLKYYVHHQLHDDYTQTSTFQFVTKILDERAVQDAKVRRLSYSTSIENLKILEAYTEKANGERIAVPENNYQQNVNSGRDKSGPVFSDRTSLSVVYPDVEVGDSIAIKYVITTSEAMFPEHFTDLRHFAPSVAYDDVEIKIEVPSNLRANYRVRGMEESIDSQGGRLTYQWKYQNPNPRKQARTDFSVWDMETYPGYIFSTFTSWNEVVQAYAQRALPKAAVTYQVKELARTITKDSIDKRDKARLLYEWVAQNISYAGNCIGVGAVVPHDIAFILDNKMGDCKDQATLLQALLTAEGIESTQALVNAGSVYKLPSIPTVTAVNHVINYLPEFDLYIDATSETVPFGLIPMSIQDKPVLLVDGYREGTRTPANQYVDSQKLTSSIVIDQQGNATGNVKVELDGLIASNSRTGFRHVTPEAEKEWLKEHFSRDGYKGFGKVSKDDPTPLEDSFNYNVEFGMQNYLPLYGVAAFVIGPDLPTPLSINSVLGTPDEANKVDMVCRPVNSEEVYSIELPENIKVIATPDDAEVEGAGISYQAKYQVEGNRLHVRRTLIDKTQGNICSHKLLAEQKEVIQKIIWDVDSQIVYKVSRQ